MVAAAITPRDQAYFDIFVTAVEGGINYWASVQRYHWCALGEDGQPTNEEDVLGFRAELYDTENPNADGGDRRFVVGIGALGGARYTRYLVNRDVIAKGVGLFIEWAKRAQRDSYMRRAAVALDWGKWDDLDVDAEIADMIVQFGLFDALIYG